MFASKDFFQATTAPSGYLLTRSLRFRASASAYLNRTPASASNRTTWTWNCWIKIGSLTQSATRIFDASTGSPIESGIVYNKTANEFRFEYYNGSSYTTQCITNATFRDPSSWYMLTVAVDTTQATAANRVIIYVNGVTQTLSTATYPAQNAQFAQNSTGTHCISRFAYAAGNYVDGYLAEVNFIDGQALTPSSFGQTDTTTGVWVPKKYTGTYGTNGFYLPFTDTSSTANLVKDTSGNGNNWTNNNISLTAGVTYDSMLDVPYCTGQVGGTQPSGNYAVLNPLVTGVANYTAPSQGNLALPSGTAANRQCIGTIKLPSTGKYYFEVANSVALSGGGVGVSTYGADIMNSGTSGTFYVYYTTSGNKGSVSSSVAYGSAWDSNTEVVGVAVDMDNGKIFFAKNNTWQASGDPVAGTNAAFTGVAGDLYPWMGLNNTSGSTRNINFGQQPFTYTPPSGFVALCAPNLASTSITTSGSFTGNAANDGPFVYLNGTPTAMTINGNSVTFGTNADKLANGFKVRTSSSSYNTAGSNTYSVSSTGAAFKYQVAQGNP